MHLMRGPRPSAGLDHLPVQVLKMLRLQSIQAVLAKSGDQVFVHRDPVCVEAAVPDARSSNVLQPML
jgi:hypothetical protein